MKKFLYMGLMLCLMVVLVSCGTVQVKPIELMGAGDRIHDTFTFANNGVELKEESENIYRVSGSINKLVDEKIKKEFNVADSVNYVIAIKLSAVDSSVMKDEVEINIDGSESYDSEHLNGSDYTFIILEAVPEKTVNISVKWNKNDTQKNYVIQFDRDLILK